MGDTTANFGNSTWEEEMRRLQRQGPILRRWYGFLNRRFGHQGKQGSLKKFAADQVFFGPSFAVLVIASVGVLQRKTPQQVVVKVRTTFVDVFLAAMMVWPAAQLINFTLVPLQFQILFVQTVRLFWNTFLAWKTNRNSNDTTEDTEDIVLQT